MLRGPSGMLFGAGTVAGVVNMVSKRPLQETQREVGVQLGSWNRKQLQADLSGPLTADGKWSYRLVAVARDADTQVDHVPDDRRLISPSLMWRPNTATSLLLQAHWQQNRTGSVAQFLPWSGTLLPQPEWPAAHQLLHRRTRRLLRYRPRIDRLPVRTPLQRCMDRAPEPARGAQREPGCLLLR